MLLAYGVYKDEHHSPGALYVVYKDEHHSSGAALYGFSELLKWSPEKLSPISYYY